MSGTTARRPLRRVGAALLLCLLAACAPATEQAKIHTAGPLTLQADGSIALAGITCPPGGDRSSLWRELRQLATKGERSTLDSDHPERANFSNEWLSIELEPQVAFGDLEEALAVAYGSSNGFWRYTISGVLPEPALLVRPRAIGTFLTDRSWKAVQLERRDGQLHVMFGELTPSGRCFDTLADAGSAAALVEQLDHTRPQWREEWAAHGYRVACGEDVAVGTFFSALERLAKRGILWRLEFAATTELDGQPEKLDPTHQGNETDPTEL